MKRLILFFYLIFSFPALATQLTLEGKREQGGLLFGTTDPGATVTLDGKPVPVSPEGRFLIAFDRDAPAAALVIVTGADGTSAEEAIEVASRDYPIQKIDGLPEEQVSPPEDLWERIGAEKALLEENRMSERAATDWLAGFIWPLQGPITGLFGRQRILNGEPRQPHYGIDIAAPVGTPVKAPGDGVVIFTHEDLFYQGKLVMIDHGQGLKSTLMHLSKISVEVGQSVKAGDIVAEVGATGRVTGAHLDWRINWFDRWIDPAQLVPPMPE